MPDFEHYTTFHLCFLVAPTETKGHINLSCVLFFEKRGHILLDYVATEYHAYKARSFKETPLYFLCH